MIGGLPCLAPISFMISVSKVIDVGCGTDVATLQLAVMFSSVKVYGLDISKVPDSAQQMTPKNIIWAVENVLDLDHEKPDKDRDDDQSGSGISRRIFTSGELDYIFGRMLFLEINN